MRLPQTFTALQHRNFRLFFFAQFVSLIGSWMQNTAQGWLVVLLVAPHTQIGAPTTHETAGVASFYLSLVSIAGSLPLFFGALFGGIVADRFSKRTVILRAQSVLMLLAFALAALVWYGHIQVWHVIAFAALTGLVNVFDIPARQSFISEMVEKRDLSNAIALNSALFNGARAFGPALAGLLLVALQNQSEQSALAQCFFWNAVSFIGVLIALSLMRGDFAPSVRNPESPLNQLREVVAYLRNNAPMRLLTLLIGVFSVFIVPYIVLLPSIARFTLHTTAREFGFLLSSLGAGAFLGALTVATYSEYEQKGRILQITGALFPLFIFGLAFSTNYILTCAILAVTAFTTTTFVATANGVFQASSPDNLRGRLMGVYSFLLMGLTPVGSLWAGVVARFFGTPAAVATGAIVAGSVMLWANLRYPALTRMGRVLPESL